MIGHRASGRGWVTAAAISVSVHAAAAGALVWQPQWGWEWQAAPDQHSAEIQLTALSLPGDDPAGEVLTPVSTALPAPKLEPLVQTGAQDPADPLHNAPLLQNTALPMVSEGGGDTPPPDPAPEQSPPEQSPPEQSAAETDPRLVELFQRIQSSLGAPCLLALPALAEDGQIRLNLLAADDAVIPALLRDLTQGLEPRSLARRCCWIRGNARLWPLPAAIRAIRSFRWRCSCNRRMSPAEIRCAARSAAAPGAMSPC